jgi:outer membrane lipoprotein carrier protein
MPRRATLVLLLALTLPLPAAGQADAVSLSDVQQAYDALDGLRAAFTQVISSDFAGDTTRIDGTVLLAGNKYRVETPTQTVVTDGQTTWIYTPADSQVVINDAEQDASTVTPETFLTASAERYEKTRSTATTRQGTPHGKLTVTATDSTSRFEEATLWVRRSDQVVTRMRATDRNGSTLDLRLRDLTVNPRLPDDTFTFAPPEGVEVIDLRTGE